MADDFLFSVGLDTRTATKDVQTFVDSSKRLLGSMPQNIILHIDTGLAKSTMTAYLAEVKKQITAIPGVSIKLNMGGATRSLKTFAAAINDNNLTINLFDHLIRSLNKTIEESMTKILEQANALERSARAIRTISKEFNGLVSAEQKAVGTTQQYTQALARLNDVTPKVGKSHKAAGDAIDEVGKIVDNTIFKFVEYEVVMRAFNGVVDEFKNSINMASQVQFEQTLQKLYAPTININKALSDSITIAKQWGGDIVDIQQAIGLWTKVTGDEVSAQYLATEAEKMHRASGIETLEVYRMSVAMLQQLGLRGRDLPRVYDQITAAALRLSEPLKAVGKSGMEGMKDLMDGMSKFSSLGKSIGLDTSAILAIVSNQIQTMGENGQQAGSQLAQMFGAMDAGGKSKINFEGILGKGAFEGKDDGEKANNVLIAMQKNAGKLAQAMADAGIKVKASQVEVEKSLQASIGKVIELSKYLRSIKTEGMLDKVAVAEMQTFGAQMDRVRSGIQAFSVSIGKELLPGLSSMAHALSTSVLPALENNAGAIVTVGHGLITLGAAALGMLVFQKASNWIYEYTVKLDAATAAGFKNVAAQEASLASASQAAMAEANLTEAIRVQGIQMGLSGVALDTHVKNTLAIGPASEVAVGGLAATGRAAGAMAMSFMEAAAPLILITGLIASVGAAYDGLDRRKSDAANFKLDLERRQNKADENSMSPEIKGFDPLARLRELPSKFGLGVKETARYFSNAGNRLTSGVGKAAGNNTSELDWFNNVKNNSSDEGRQASFLLNEYKSKKYSNNSDELSRIHGQMENLYQNHMMADAFTKTSVEMNKLKEETQKRLKENIAGSGFDTQQGTPEGHVFGNAPVSTKGQSTPESREKLAIGEIKNRSQETINGYRDQASAAKTYATAIQDEAKATGDSKELAKAYAASLNDETRFTKLQAQATLQEAAALKAKIPELERAKLAHAESTTAGVQDARLWSTTTKAYLDAENAAKLLTAKVRELTAANRDAISSNNYKTDLQLGGYDTYQKQLESQRKKVGSTTTSGDELQALGGENAFLTKALSFAEHLNKLYKDNATQLETNKNWVSSIKDEQGEVAKKIDDTNVKLAKSIEDAQTLFDTIYGQNTVDMGAALGADAPGDLASITFKIEQYKKLHEQQILIQKSYDDLGANPDKGQLQNINNSANELKIRSSLIDVLGEEKRIKEDIKKTEDSSIFKSVNSEIDKLGSKGIAKLSDGLFGKGNEGIQGAIKGIGTSVLDGLWKDQSKKFTEGIFGLDKDKEKEKSLKDMYDQHLAGEKIIMDRYKAITDQFSASMPLARESNGNILTSTIGNKLPQSQAQTTEGLGKALADMVGKPLDNAITGGNPSQASDMLNSSNKTAEGVQKIADTVGQSGGGGNLDLTSMLQGTGSSGSSSLVNMLMGISSGGVGGGLAARIGTSAGSNSGNVIPGISRALGASEGLNTPAGPTSLLSSLSDSLSKLGSKVGWGTSHGMTSSSLGLGLASGSMFGELAGGGSHSTWGEIGGAAGSLFGPVGSVVGAAVGSLFGHADSPKAMPDKYDPNFGQLQANLTGQSYSAELGGRKNLDPSVAGITGGQGEIAFIEEQLSKYASKDAAPAWLKSQYDQLVNDFGVSSTGSGKIGYDSNIANEKITGAAGASQTSQNYQNLQNDVATFMAGYANHKTAQAPIISENSYGNPNGYGASVYNTPGMNAKEYAALQENSFQGTGYPNYYGTPGIGTSTPGGGSGNMRYLEGSSATQNPINITTQVMLDSRILATAVNAVNSASANRTAIM